MSDGRGAKEQTTKLLWLVAIVCLSLCVRAGTAHFVSAHLNDAGWFQYGSYQIFDKRAQHILDGIEPAFFLTDPTRTDLVQYPPAFPVLVGLVYFLSGERSAYAVLRVQWPLDAVITPLLILGIAVSAFGWRTGYAAGIMAALSPMLAFYGATPSADAVTMWTVLAAVWLLLIAFQRRSWRRAFLTGTVLGIACWLRVNPLFLVVGWVAAIMLLTSLSIRQRALLCCSMILGTVLIVAPIIVRNVLVYREPVLTGLSVGVNLWEGLGETELGRENGFAYGDELMMQKERFDMGRPNDLSIEPFWPDGIKRDRERTRSSLNFILAHPIWYIGVMLERVYWMLKIAGEPGPYYGTAGINCTAEKCLAEDMRESIVKAGVTLLGMAQSVYRFLAIPLAAMGIIAGWLRHRAVTSLLLATVLYYLFASSTGHTELRYVLPMHAVLVAFGAFGLVRSVEFLSKALFGPRAHREV